MIHMEHIHASQRVNPFSFERSISFVSAPPSGQNINYAKYLKIQQAGCYKSSINIHSPQRMVAKNSGDP